MGLYILLEAGKDPLQGTGIRWLDEVAITPRVKGQIAIALMRPACDGDEVRVGQFRQLPHLLNHFPALLAGMNNVQKHHIGADIGGLSQGFLKVVRDMGMVAPGVDEESQAVRRVFTGVNNEDTQHFDGHDGVHTNKRSTKFIHRLRQALPVEDA